MHTRKVLTSVSLSQVSVRSNPNTHQSGRIQASYIGENLGDGYSLLSYNLQTGEAKVQSPNSILPYRVNFRPAVATCTCRGYEFSPAGEKRCRHTDLSHSVGAAIWQAIWRRESVTASRVGRSVYSDFMTDDLTDSEAECLNRWLYIAEWEA